MNPSPFRLLFCLILALAFGSVAVSAPAGEGDLEPPDSRKFYRPMVWGLLLPAVLTALCIAAFRFYGFPEALPMLAAPLGQVLIHLSAWYALLLLLLPLLRSRIRARTCALLWMVPNYLYLTFLNPFPVEQPLLILPVSRRGLQTAAWIWGIGFLAVFSWSLLSHLRFRRQILREAVPVTDPEVLEILDGEVQKIWEKNPHLQVVRSPAVATPLSIGMFRHSVRIVLPEQTYTPLEYRLLLRHELIHISREDACSKFFLLFCRALGWFHPLMWLAARKSADDLERSCDEAVLLQESPETAMEYARLILRTAGDDRGFSTCLSSAASTLRYRLKSLTGQSRKRSGALAVTLLTLVLFLSCGLVTFACEVQTGQEALYDGEDLSRFTLEQIRTAEGSYDPDVDFVDCAALEEWLCRLPMREIADRHSVRNPASDPLLTLTYRRSPEGSLILNIWDSRIRVFTDIHALNSPDRQREYHLEQPVDRDFLLRTVPPPVNASLSLLRPDGRTRFTSPLDLTLVRFACVSPGSEQVLVDHPDSLPQQILTGNVDCPQAAVEFSCPPVSDLLVTLSPMDGTASQTVPAEEGPYPGSWTFPIPSPPSRCRIRGTFQGPTGLHYEAEFACSIERMDD